MKKVIDLLYHAFNEKELTFVLVSAVDGSGYNHLAITDEQANQIVRDYGFSLEIMKPEDKMFKDGAFYSKYKFMRAII